MDYKIKYFITRINKHIIIKIIKIIIIVGMVIPCYFLLTGCRNNEKSVLYARDGVMEIHDWNFKKDGSVELKGEWEFYWDTLMEPSQFSEHTKFYGNRIIAPRSWKGVRIDHIPLPHEGVATYRLLVKMDSLPLDMALKIKFFISASKVWVDRDLVYTSGVVGNRQLSEGEFNPGVFTIHPSKKEFYITVQVSNYGYAYGGMITGILIGDTMSLVNGKNIMAFSDIFVFGGIFIMGIYHLILYFFRRKDFSVMYFSIICFILSIRTLLMGEMLLYNFIKGIPLGVFLALSGSSMSFGIMFFILYIRSIFTSYIPKWFVWFSVIYGGFFALINILSDKLSSVFLLPFQIISIFVVLMLLILLVKAARSDRETCAFFSLAIFSVLLLLLNDVLNNYGLLNTGYFVHLCTFLFITIQAYMLFRNLLKQENQIVKSELRMLQAQIKPHFLFNALNTIISVSIMSSDKTVELLQDLSSFLKCSFSFKSDDEFVDFDIEMIHVKSYLAIEKARFLERLNVIYDIEEGISCKVPGYIIQPLVENGVRHGLLPKAEGGTITISAKCKGDFICIEVKDDGVGMSKERREAILNNKSKNVGIGIWNVKNRIKKIYKTDLEVISTLNKGTSVTIRIPVF